MKWDKYIIIQEWNYANIKHVVHNFLLVSGFFKNLFTLT